MLYIDPEVCIDCGACVSACPVEAIFAEPDVPKQWEAYVERNAAFYRKIRA
jgi:ferredoxin